MYKNINIRKANKKANVITHQQRIQADVNFYNNYGK